MRRKGLSIFQKLFIAFFCVGFITLIGSGVVNYKSKKGFIERTIEIQLTDSLERSIDYFNKTFTIPIKKDLGFIEASTTLNNFLTSQKDEALLTKPPVERLFLFFTDMPESIYLSSRFIDPKGKEKIITAGNKRVRDYATIDHFPDNVLYRRIYSLFERLKKENVGSILFEGPFKYKNKFTFVIGVSKTEPGIGGFGGAVIFHCDLTGYLNYLSDIRFNQIPVAFVFSPDNHLMLLPGKEASHDPGLYLSPEENTNNPLVVSSPLKLGSNNNTLLNFTLSVPRGILTTSLQTAFIRSALIGMYLIILIGLVTFFISMRFFVRPIKELSRGTEKIAGGDLDYRIKIETHDEIAQLADEFNRMTENLKNTTVSRDILIQEVDERKQAEEALRESEDKFRMLSEQSLVGIIIIQDDIFKYVNQELSDIYEYPIEEMLNWEPGEFAKIIHPDDRAFLVEQARKKQLGVEDVIVNYDFRAMTKTGKMKWVELYSKTISFGGKSADFVTMIDITDRKRVEEALKESEEKYRTQFEEALDAIFIGDAEEGIIMDCNQAASELVGRTKSEMVGKHQRILHPPEEVEGEFSRTFKSHIKEKEGQALHAHVITKNGAIRDVSIKANIFEIKGKKILQGIFRDITDHKRAEEKLKEYSEHLEEMVEDRTKDLKDAQEQLVRREKLALLGQLAGSMGHELRNPLGVISNAVYYLKMVLPDADETIKEYTDIISSEVQNSEKIVSDLLDFSRVRQGGKEEITVTELVARALERQPPPDSVEVVTEIVSDLLSVYVDARQIVQILVNLISNACHAMSEGGTLAIHAKGNLDHVRLSVADTGSGISEENMGKIFEPLFTTRARGIGLGLAVSRNLIEVNGGSIEVKSKEGKGSVFTITLPVKEEE